MPNLIPDVVPAGSMAAGPQPSLRAGPAFQLRPWHVDDVPAVVAAYSDPDIQRWHLQSKDKAEAYHWIHQWKSLWQREIRADWAISEVTSGVVLGRIGLREIHLDEGRAEVAYWVLPAARGRGVASTGLEALAAWAFDEIGLHRLDLQHSVHNEASCRVATKTGFELDGVLRSFFLHHDGWHDVHVHGRIRPGVNNCPTDGPAH